MGTALQSERETYRVIVLGRDGKEILLVPDGDRMALPYVKIPCWQRVAENLTAAVRTEWGEQVICLFEPDDLPGIDGAGVRYQAAEHWCATGIPKTPTRWVLVSALSDDSFHGASDYPAIQRSIAQCDAEGHGSPAGPFARLGWFRELREWVEEVVEPLGHHLNGRFSQLNASPSFSLLRFQTNGPAVWFKAVGKPNLREFPVTLALAKSFPQYTPSVLAVRPDLNGWLSPEVEGTNLDETQDAQAWRTAASALAKLQLESLGDSTAFIQYGARDLRASTLLQLVRPFMDAMAQLMEAQTKVPPPILSRTDLLLLGEQVEEALSLSTDLGIPDALGHLDLNPGNVLISRLQCVFLDWAEACVGQPFFSFQYLLESFRRITDVNMTHEPRLITAYAQHWRPLISQESIVESLALAPLLAVFACAAGSEAWSDERRLRDSVTAGYLRSLTRRMKREAQQLRGRGVPCAN